MARSIDRSPSPLAAGAPRRRRRSPSRSASRSPSPPRKASPQARRFSRSRSRSGSPRRDAPKPCKILGVFGLNYTTTRRDLERHFSRYGDIDKVDLITDNQGRSRGFGFINFFAVEDAKKARAAMTDKEFHGRRIRVDFSISKGPHQRTPGSVPLTTGHYMGRGRESESGSGRRSRSPSPRRRRSPSPVRRRGGASRSPSPPVRRRGASRSPSPARRRRYSRSPTPPRRRD